MVDSMVAERLQKPHILFLSNVSMLQEKLSVTKIQNNPNGVHSLFELVLISPNDVFEFKEDEIPPV